MPARVIDAFEMIKINQNDCEAPALTQVTRMFSGNFVENDAAVREPGQLIVGGAKTRLLACGDQAILKIQNALAHAKASSKLRGIERFCEVVVGAGFQPSQQIVPLAARCKQKNVNVRSVWVRPHPPADFRAFQTRHHPIQYRERRGIFAFENSNRVQAVRRGHHLISPLLEECLKHAARNGVVFGNQDAICACFFVGHF